MLLRAQAIVAASMTKVKQGETIKSLSVAQRSGSCFRRSNLELLTACSKNFCDASLIRDDGKNGFTKLGTLSDCCCQATIVAATNGTANNQYKYKESLPWS